MVILPQGRRARPIRPALLLLPLLAQAASADPILESLDRLYNFDFPAAHKILDPYVAQRPDDPLGHAFRASAFLFQEMDRLRILESEFLSSDKRISGAGKLKPDPAVRERFFASVTEAQRLAGLARQKNPEDTNALFAFAMTEGLRTDYMAFIEKKQLRSLAPARRSHLYAVELLRHDPHFADAYLTTGISEYLIGSLPFFIRWVARFDHVQGSKQQAVANLEKAARQARYMGPFARILLAIIHLREKKPQRSLEILDGLVRQYPENPLLKAELEKLRKKLGAD